MTGSTTTLQVLTLLVASVAAGGASYAALLTGRIQRKAADRQREWETKNAEQIRLWQRTEVDRIRGLDQLRAAYEADVLAVTRIEQLFWHAANLNIPSGKLPESYKDQIRTLVREHAAQHGVVHLLGSKPVVEQADIVGRDITRAMFSPDKDRVSKLSASRAELISRMRQDLELETALIQNPAALYDASHPAASPTSREALKKAKDLQRRRTRP